MFGGKSWGREVLRSVHLPLVHRRLRPEGCQGAARPIGHLVIDTPCSAVQRFRV